MTHFQPLIRRKDNTEQFCYEIVCNSAWFLYCTKLFTNVCFAVLDTYPYKAITAKADPLGIMGDQSQSVNSLSNTVTKSKFQLVAPEEDESLEMRPAKETPKMAPILFSASHCGMAGRWALLAEITTSKIMYLDLSYTVRDAASNSVLPHLHFPQLRVLKLRGLRMVDAEFIRMVSVGAKLWSLDVSENNLTDVVVEHLLIHFILLDNIEPYKSILPQLPDQHLFDDVPEYHRDEDGEMRDTTAPLRSDNTNGFKDYIEKTSSKATINDQILDSNDPFLRRTGLTHLHISENRLTSRGVKLLLTHTNRLQVLDVGSVESIGFKQSQFYVPYTTPYAQLESAQGLSRESRSRMQHLRVHHSLVTYVPTILNIGSRNHGFILPLVEEAEKFATHQMSTVKTNPEHKAFSPLQNYCVTKLSLTGIPTKSYGFTIERLIELLAECRIQEEKLEEAATWTKKSRRAPELLPGLRTLRLEFLPEDTALYSPGGGSVSGDRDADTFLASSEGDFSFFADPNTMSSVSRRGSVTSTGGGATTGPTVGPAAATATVTLNDRPGSSFAERMALGRNTASVSETASRRACSSSAALAAPLLQPPPYQTVVKDVVEELKKYRATREGKWTGDLQLVFPHGR